MASAETRTLYEIKRDAERSRMELAQTVDRLRSSVAGARASIAPEAIKARVSNRLTEAARNNPAQAAAIGALAAWPLVSLVRAMPLPLALVGAGLFLTGSKTARDFASTTMDEAGRRAHDLSDASSEAMDLAATRVADAAGRVAETARTTAGRLGAAASDAVAGLSDASEDVADRAAQWAEQAVDQGAGIGAHLGAEAQAGAAHIGASARDAGRKAAACASDLLNRALENPALVGGIGLAIGAFIASGLPATAVERQVGETVKGGVKAAAAAEMARAAGAVVRAATAGLANDRQSAAASGATARGADVGGGNGRGERGVTGG